MKTRTPQIVQAGMGVEDNTVLLGLGIVHEAGDERDAVGFIGNLVLQVHELLAMKVQDGAIVDQSHSDILGRAPCEIEPHQNYLPVGLVLTYETAPESEKLTLVTDLVTTLAVTGVNPRYGASRTGEGKNGYAAVTCAGLTNPTAKEWNWMLVEMSSAVMASRLEEHTQWKRGKERNSAKETSAREFLMHSRHWVASQSRNEGWRIAKATAGLIMASYVGDEKETRIVWIVEPDGTGEKADANAAKRIMRAMDGKYGSRGTEPSEPNRPVGSTYIAGSVAAARPEHSPDPNQGDANARQEHQREGGEPGPCDYRNPGTAEDAPNTRGGPHDQ